MKQSLQFNKLLKSTIILGDLCIMNLLFVLFYRIFDKGTLGTIFIHSLPQILILLNLVYLLCNYNRGVILYRRIVRPDHIVRRAARNVLLHALVFCTLFNLADFGTLSFRYFIAFYTAFFFCLAAYRLTFREVLKWYRRHGGNSRTIILIGSDENMHELYGEISIDPAYGFRIKGYFAPATSLVYPDTVPYLGNVDDVIPWIRQNGVEMVFCGLSSSYEQQILPVINYCENNLIHFYSVPNVRNYLRHRMYFEMIGSVPILSIRKEPLGKIENRLIKRIFDVAFSSLFLCTLFPIIFLIVGVTIKITSPGPIFFRQKRNGLNNKEFWCYKFRSMKVNKESDTLQATLNDPRKTKFGDFMRRTNIDELPQFINVLLGDMSIVGPRPHMLKHTEEYSKIINKYMVRHFIKPGITGWAQVTGFRGETRELEDMEGRVKADIWYMEHWTFTLDMYIIYKTVANVFLGDKNAY